MCEFLEIELTTAPNNDESVFTTQELEKKKRVVPVGLSSW
jgi:hypothetical protein